MGGKDKALNIRNYVYFLDIHNNPEHMKIYKQKEREFLVEEEGKKYRVYDDAKRKVVDPEEIEGNVTIGIGYNMDNGKGEKVWAAKEEWKKIFSHKGDPSFDEVYRGKRLSDAEVERLYVGSIESRRERIKKLLGEVYFKLEPNVLLTFTSLYFNGPGLVQKGTKAYQHIQEYAQTGKIEHLNLFREEVEKRSNKHKITGVQRRHERESALADVTAVPGYSPKVAMEPERPREPSLPSKPQKPTLFAFADPFADPAASVDAIALGSLVPHSLLDRWIRMASQLFFRRGERVSDPDLYIWRTQEDGKVRESHQDNNGRLFSKSAPPPTGNPGEDYNCRCWAEHIVPPGIPVIERLSKVLLA